MTTRTRWILMILGIPFALVLPALGIGMTLPVSHTATVSERMAAPPDSVWAAMTAVEGFPAWRPGIDSVVRLPDRNGLPAWRETGTYGTMTLEVTAWEPPRRFVTRIADQALPFGGTRTHELAPDGDGTRVILTEDGEVYGPSSASCRGSCSGTTPRCASICAVSRNDWPLTGESAPAQLRTQYHTRIGLSGPQTDSFP